MDGKAGLRRPGVGRSDLSRGLLCHPSHYAHRTSARCGDRDPDAAVRVGFPSVGSAASAAAARAVGTARADRACVVLARWRSLRHPLALLTAVAGAQAFSTAENLPLDEAIYWSEQTMTTAEYGDITPTTNLGRAVAVVVMLVGIGFVAIVTGALAQGFIAPTRRGRTDERARAAPPARRDRRASRPLGGTRVAGALVLLPCRSSDPASRAGEDESEPPPAIGRRFRRAGNVGKVGLEPTAVHRSTRGWPPVAVPDAWAVSRRAQVAQAPDRGGRGWWSCR